MPRYALTNYTVQCKDVTTGETGCFLFDAGWYQQNGTFKAISPVYPGLMELFKNTTHEQRQGKYLEYKGT
jgi:hypothetical protein